MGSFASGTLAGVLHGLDGITLDRMPMRRRGEVRDRLHVVHGIWCTDGLQTLVDLAALTDDSVWEQALESTMRMGLTTVEAIDALVPELGRARTPGTARIRRVLARRPPGAPATESLLETLMVQLARHVPGLGDPARQLVVSDRHGSFVARVDLAWPEIGLFVELDGQHHKEQPVYDARRETAVVAATGWHPGRFTWREVSQLRRTTTRRLHELAEQARGRPIRA